MTVSGGAGGEMLLGGSCLPCTPEEERDTVEELVKVAEDNTKDGDLRFLVSYRWWVSWQQYVGLVDSDNMLPVIISRPGEIDNSKLIIEGQSDVNGNLELKRNLREGEDYQLVAQEVWRKLHDWYKGGPEISRKVIFVSQAPKGYIVDVYPLCLKLIDARNHSVKTIVISRKAKIRELYEMVCSLVGVEQSKANIWDYYEKTKAALLANLDQSLEEAQLQMDQDILLELEVQGDEWPFEAGIDSTGNGLALVTYEPTRSPYSIAGGLSLSNGYSADHGPSNYSPVFGFNDHSSAYGSNTFSPGYGSNFLQSASFNSLSGDADVYSASSSKTMADDQGLTGLSNLGNTCFMNSAIQCLVHTPPLVEFFLDEYSEQINEVNPLGTQGELATAFGELLRKLWSAGRSCIAPRAFKARLSKFAPQFSGYNQHDAQELLAFLLDGLHEDLNRVIKKPYIEQKDSDGRSDAEFADECWKNHKARNDSIIVDLFQGQYKSTLVCPICSKVSVTFDPFMYLSLPLPSKLTRTITVTVISAKGDAIPTPYTVNVDKNGFVKDLKNALSNACSLKDSEILLLAEVYERRIYRYIQHLFEPLIDIKDGDQLVAFILPASPGEQLRLEIFHRRENRIPEPQFNMQRKMIAIPLVTCTPNMSPSKAEIYSAVSSILSPLLRETTPPSNHLSNNESNNGYRPSLDSMALTDDDLACSSEMDSSLNVDEDIISDELPSFKLWITDEQGLMKMPIHEDFNRAHGITMKLILEWSEREFERYNISYIEDVPDVYKPEFMSKKTRQDPVDLFSCLDAFLKEEPLGPDDMWYCPTCKEHRQATKKLDLWSLPEILVFHLKRFSFSRFSKNKLDTFIDFPIHNLDLRSYINNPNSLSPFYELYAISNHYGNLGGGHYTAYAKLVQGEGWYHFDDSHVSVVGEDEIKTSAAYVLFYRRAIDSSRMGTDITMTRSKQD